MGKVKLWVSVAGVERGGGAVTTIEVKLPKECPDISKPTITFRKHGDLVKPSDDKRRIEEVEAACTGIEKIVNGRQTMIHKACASCDVRNGVCFNLEFARNNVV